jgi:hypothetical protein
LLRLEFTGWFQCRLATDPDPTDESRGVSGGTFAYAGEPDLDRIIRFGSPPYSRAPGPKIGVTIVSVYRDGRRISHPLTGATVDLLNDPHFEGRNGLIASPGHEPIHPFHVRVSRGATFVQRFDLLGSQHEDLLDAEPRQLERRAGNGLEFSTAVTNALQAATGIADFRRFHEDRAAALRDQIATTGDPVKAAALRARHANLRAIDRMRVSYAFRVGEYGEVGQVSSDMDASVDSDAPWPIEFWLGAWDSDALAGYVSGSLTLPTRGR